MSFSQKTYDNILNGSISVIQYKKGFRFGSDAVFLASFVNGFIETKKNRKFYIADVGSGVGTVSLIIASRNPNSNILAIDNKREYLIIAEENIKINNFQDQIKTIDNDVFNFDNNLKNSFDLVFVDPPYGKGIGQQALKILKKSELLKTETLIILEEGEQINSIESFSIEECRRYGSSYAHFLTPNILQPFT